VCLPIVSDANPLFEGGMFHPELDPNTTNTQAHRSKGQNVLCTDGRFVWRRSPVMANGDNIWVVERITAYVGNEVPSAATDAFIVP
jgi:hypothetical protein